MINILQIKKELETLAGSKKADHLMKFFKVFVGGYGEGDQFIGVNVPSQRAIAKKYFNSISLEDMEILLRDKVHECRLTALFLLTYRLEKSKKLKEKKEIANLYVRNIEHINNWDLVDLSAYKILGSYLWDKDKSLLYEYANSKHLWKQRISIITTFYFIRKKQYKDTLAIAEILLKHKHDLIHKAVGWMLREVGKRDFSVEETFLKKHYKQMPRTMLRYAIEKFEESLRQQFLKGDI